MLKIKQKLTIVSNGIGRGSIMYLVPKVLSEKNIDPLFNPFLEHSLASFTMANETKRKSFT